MRSINLIINKIYPYLATKVRLFIFRKQAHHLIKRVRRCNGYQIVDGQVKKSLRSYAKQRFGNSSYWPWLSLYTEVWGEFKEGWIPYDYYKAHLLKKYNPVSIRISDYKTFDHKIFPDFALKPLVIKIDANFYDSNRKQIRPNEAKNILYDYHDEVVLKEDRGFGGHNVNFIESRKLNFDHYSHISSYIIQPVVRQHENLKALNNKAVNSIRVLTYLDAKGKFNVKYSYLRFGIGESRVDNTSSGGGFCFIKSNGNLADTAYNEIGIKMGKEHPDSGTAFKSVVVPNYDNVLKQCIRSHKMFPYFRFIGWDVTVDKAGELVLLEWNSKPDIWIAEAIEGPFFKDEIMADGRANWK